RWLVGGLAVAGLAAACWVLARGGDGFTATVALGVALGGILLVQGWTDPPRYAARTNLRGLTSAMAARLPPRAPRFAYADARAGLRLLPAPSGPRDPGTGGARRAAGVPAAR